MADSFIQLPPDSTGKKLDADELTIGANTVQRQRVLAIPPRSNQVPGRTGVFKSGVGTGDLLVHTTTASKTLYVTSFSFIVYNTDTINRGTVYILNGTTNAGTIIRSYYVPQTPTGAAPAVVMDSVAMPEPIPFSSGVFVDVAAGSLNFSIMISGYEE